MLTATGHFEIRVTRQFLPASRSDSENADCFIVPQSQLQRGRCNGNPRGVYLFDQERSHTRRCGARQRSGHLAGSWGEAYNLSTTN